MKNLILIPARSGSTRVKNKNIYCLGNKPLIAHTIDNAIASNSGRVVVSTNSEEIGEIACNFGAETPFYRPEDISSASSTSIAVIIHALQWFKENENWSPEMVAFRPPTNPFIKPQTIDDMFQRLHEKETVNSIVTITKPKTHPFRIIKQHADGMIENGIISLEGNNINDLERSQDWPVVWEGSPGCRLTRCDYFVNMSEKRTNPLEITGKTYDVDKCIGYEIDPFEAFDIDDKNDLRIAEVLYASMQ